jgi:bifunctional NMN adenylyltransferase/nudix hydrolase
MQYDYLIFIGRFQPFHNGHKYIVNEGLKISDKIIILCGSANQKRSVKNPWTYSETKEYITRSFDEASLKKIHIERLNDYADDATWVVRVEEIVNKIIAYDELCAESEPCSNPKMDVQKKFIATYKIGLIGHNKDQTSYYLALFPKWQQVIVPNFKGINATDIREALFKGENEQSVTKTIENLVPKKVLLFLMNFLKTEDYLQLKKR